MRPILRPRPPPHPLLPLPKVLLLLQIIQSNRKRAKQASARLRTLASWPSARRAAPGSRHPAARLQRRIQILLLQSFMVMPPAAQKATARSKARHRQTRRVPNRPPPHLQVHTTTTPYLQTYHVHNQPAAATRTWKKPTQHLSLEERERGQPVERSCLSALTRLNRRTCLLHSGSSIGAAAGAGENALLPPHRPHLLLLLRPRTKSSLTPSHHHPSRSSKSLPTASRGSTPRPTSMPSR